MDNVADWDLVTDILKGAEARCLYQAAFDVDQDADAEFFGDLKRQN